MRPHAHSAVNQQTQNYELIIKHYLNYVLIRSLAYTNDRTLAGRIAVYTLITTCLLSGRLRRKRDLGIVVDTMVGMIGDDQVISDRRQVTSDQLKTQDSELRIAEACVFLLDARLCEVAGAINGVDGFTRQVLVLHHIEAMDVPALAEAYETSPGRIVKAIAKGEREFVEILRGMSSWNHEVEPDVHNLLTDLAGRLDADWSTVVADSALHYLAEHGGQL